MTQLFNDSIDKDTPLHHVLTEYIRSQTRLSYHVLTEYEILDPLCID